MKAKISTLKIAFITIFIMFMANTSLAFDNCTLNSDKQVTTSMSGVSESFCYIDPTHRKVEAYKIGLCTELPYANNYKTVCDFIYNSPTPIVLEAEKGISKAVSGFGDITLIEGKEYTHSVMLISNKTYVKSLIQFPSTRLGATGKGGTGSGTWCWSSGGGVNLSVSNTFVSSRSTFTATCGTETEANPVYNFELSNSFASAVSGEDKPAVERNFPTWSADASHTNRGWSNELMSDEDTKAVFNTTPASWSDATTNSVYWLAGRPINPSVSVTATNNTLDLRFLVSYGALIQYSGDSDSGAWDTECDTTPCIGMIRTGGFDTNVTIE